MKKIILPLAFAGMILSANKGKSQAHFDYSYSISALLNAGAAGIQLPDGTIVTAVKTSTGGGIHDATSGDPGPSIGGTFTGVTMSAYQGSNAPALFTKISTANTSTIDNGISNNCAPAIGFYLHFSKPTTNVRVLGIDIDGLNANPGNAEWTTAFGYNGNTFVPYNQTIAANANLAPATVTVGGSHAWRTMLSAALNSTASANFPATYPVQHGNANPAPSGSPDDTTTQVFLQPGSAAVTDLFTLFGLWRQPPSANSQTSGFSPLVVSVSADFGDAPDSYKTLLASGGPSHGVTPTLQLGTTVDAKANGQPGSFSNLDPNDDGVSVVPTIINNGSSVQTVGSYSLTTSFTNATGVPANYVAWIDWNNDGVFDPSEGQTVTTPAGQTSGTVTFTWTNAILANAGGLDHTYARLRLTTDPITTSDIGGAFKDGEVEDYRVPFVTPLPLQLTSFTCQPANNHAVLSWITADESNLSDFEIQSGTDGHTFKTIGHVQAANAAHTYTFTDGNELNATVYYRLKINEKNDATSFSSIIKLTAANMVSDELDIAPNPVVNTLQLRVSKTDAVQVAIYNITGQPVGKQTLSGANYYMIDCSSLKPGMYILQTAENGHEIKTAKFIKK